MKHLVAILFLIFSITAVAETPLPAEQAFQFSTQVIDSQTIAANWRIAPDCYLYRDRIQFTPKNPNEVQFLAPIFPPAEKKESALTGIHKIYRNDLEIKIPVQKAINPEHVEFQVTYQGCSEKGFCYPPITKNVSVNLKQPVMEHEKVEVKAAPSANSQIVNLLQSRIWVFILGFLGIGLLIAFTPCCLPMIPILSAIIVGQTKKSTVRSFMLSLMYVMGMAVTYAIAGVLFGYMGGSVQALFQKTWIIVLFSLVFVLMALSSFGFFNVQLPERLRVAISEANNKAPHGTYLGTLVMGALSVLILSPCVTPPLVGVLTYISQTGHAAMGGLALFTMAIGMGLPLLVIGATGARFLPKAGRWMNLVKNFLGVLLLGMAIMMLHRVLPDPIIMMLWAALVIGVAIYLGAFHTSHSFWQLMRKGLGIILFVYGIVLLVGAFLGNTDPLKPIQIQAAKAPEENLSFLTIKKMEDLKKFLELGKKENRIVLLDFSAKWCTSCSELDAFTFSNPKVQEKLKNFILLRADISANDQDDKNLLQTFGVIAPPTLLFFKDGKELTESRIVGFINANDLQTKLNSLE